jgi:hypothetical protein
MGDKEQADASSPNWSCPLPRPLKIPSDIDLKTITNVWIAAGAGTRQWCTE